MPISLTDDSKPFVCLEGIDRGNRFFTSNTKGIDPTKSAKGETWYKVLAYCDESKEAQSVIYGDGYDPTVAYLKEQEKFFGKDPRIAALIRGIHLHGEIERIVTTDTQTLIDGEQAIHQTRIHDPRDQE
jgi:hypothetical protein